MALDTIRPGVRLEEGDLIYASDSRPQGQDRFTLLLAFRQPYPHTFKRTRGKASENAIRIKLRNEMKGRLLYDGW